MYATATQLGSLVVANNMVTGMTDGDFAIEVVAGIYPIVIRGNSLATSLTEGYSIKLRGGGDGGGPVVIEDNILLGDETNNLPFFIESGTPGGAPGTTDYNRKLRVSAHRNRRHTVDWYQETQYYDDIDGAVLTYINTIIPQVRTSWETPTKYLPRRRENLLTLGQNTRAQGNNLRVPAKFATSSTATVTFQRTITITSPGSGSEVGTRAWTVDSGAVYESDLGRIIGITNSGVHYVYITKILSSTSFETAGADDTSGSSLSATIGENEPDDDYMVFPSCNANETISWSSLSTTGFTLTSSNGSSTATCHVLILR